MDPSGSTTTDAQPASGWATNGDVRLHYLDARPTASGRPVVFVPGFGEEAADHLPLLGALAPRRVVAADLRGRGPSTVAERGYSFEDHVADVGAVVEASGVDRFHLVTYSRGTTYGLGWALRHAERIVSISIGDYLPLQIAPGPAMVDAAAKRIWRGRPMTDRISLTAVTQLMQDAVAMEFWDELGALGVPVLLVRGGARGAMVDDAGEARYRSSVPDLRVVRFEESNHDLWSPDPERFVATVRAFLDDVDARG